MLELAVPGHRMMDNAVPDPDVPQNRAGWWACRGYRCDYDYPRLVGLNEPTHDFVRYLYVPWRDPYRFYVSLVDRRSVEVVGKRDMVERYHIVDSDVGIIG